jgi:hypothetical protein
MKSQQKPCPSHSPCLPGELEFEEFCLILTSKLGPGGSAGTSNAGPIWREGSEGLWTRELVPQQWVGEATMLHGDKVSRGRGGCCYAELIMVGMGGGEGGGGQLWDLRSHGPGITCIEMKCKALSWASHEWNFQARRYAPGLARIHSGSGVAPPLFK